MTTEVVSNDLTAALRRLKLSGLLNTLPDRLTLARAQKMPYQVCRLAEIAAVERSSSRAAAGD